MTIDVVTFGCRLNSAESEVIRREAAAGGVSVFDSSSGRLLRRIVLSGNFGEVRQLVVSPTGRHAALVCTTRVRVLDLNAGEEAYRFDPHYVCSTSADFSPDGNRLAISAGGAVHLHEVGTARPAVPRTSSSSA